MLKKKSNNHAKQQEPNMLSIQLKTTLSTGMFPKAQKAVAKKHLNLLLNKLPQGSQAYVAGGAPRDWHHGWGCRDIDIFFSVPKEFKTHVTAMLDTECDKVSQDYSQGGYGVNNNPLLHSVHEYNASKLSPRAKSTEYTKVQLIQTNIDALEVIKDFPISLSRIWMDKDGDINCCHMYAQSYNNRIIHELNETHGWNYIYLDKILGRFPQYTFIPRNWQGQRDVSEQIDIGF